MTTWRKYHGQSFRAVLTTNIIRGLKHIWGLVEIWKTGIMKKNLYDRIIEQCTNIFSSFRVMSIITQMCCRLRIFSTLFSFISILASGLTTIIVAKKSRTFGSIPSDSKILFSTWLVFYSKSFPTIEQDIFIVLNWNPLCY